MTLDLSPMPIEKPVSFSASNQNLTPKGILEVSLQDYYDASVQMDLQQTKEGIETATRSRIMNK
jgi:hypothetical protein